MNMDWNGLEREMKMLAEKIDYKPDAIIGIVRGGLVPARILSSMLHAKEMYCLTVRKNGDERRVVTEITDDLSDKNILLVEDMLETGKSLIVAKKYLEHRGAKVKTACLFIMPKSEIVPDFFLRKIEEPMHFPWE